MKRETPRFSPSALKPAPPANLRLCFPDCRPPAPQQDNRMDGQTTDGRTQRRGAGRRGLGVSAGCPLPAARPGEAAWGFFFGSSLRARPRRGAAPAGRTGQDGAAEALTPARPWQRRQRGSETPPSPALRPPPIPEQRAEQRRGGGCLRRGPRPRRPRFAPGPASAVAPAPRSLSPPSQKQRDSLSSIFYLINFHFLHKTSNCKYF